MGIPNTRSCLVDGIVDTTNEFPVQQVAEEEYCSRGSQEVSVQAETEPEKEEQEAGVDAIGETKIEIGQTLNELPGKEEQEVGVDGVGETKIETGQTSNELPVKEEQEVGADAIGETKMESRQTSNELPVVEFQSQAEEESPSRGCQEKFQEETELDTREKKDIDVLCAIGETKIELGQTSNELPIMEFHTQAEDEGQSTGCREENFQGETDLDKREKKDIGLLDAGGESMIEIEQAMKELPAEQVLALVEEEGQSTGSQEVYSEQEMINKQKLNKEIEIQNLVEQDFLALSTLKTVTEAQRSDYVSPKALSSSETSLIVDISSATNETQSERIDDEKVELVRNSMVVSAEQTAEEYKDEKMTMPVDDNVKTKECGYDSAAKMNAVAGAESDTGVSAEPKVSVFFLQKV